VSSAQPVHEVLEQTLAALETANSRADNLEIALQSNRRIGIAIGILMSSRQLSEADALDCLVQASQGQNRKLAHVADDVARTGAL
jgi:AmiR/NasT family two-component response regulator